MGHFQEAGRSLCGALLDYYLPNSTQRDAFFRGNEANEPSTPETMYQSAIVPNPRASIENSKSGRRRAHTSASSHAEGFQGIGVTAEDSDIDDLGSEDSDNGPHVEKDITSTSPTQLVKGVSRRRLGLGRRLNVATSPPGKSNSCNAIGNQRKSEVCGFSSLSQTPMATGGVPRSLASLQSSSANSSNNNNSNSGQRGSRQRQVIVSNIQQPVKLPQPASRVRQGGVHPRGA